MRLLMASTLVLVIGLAWGTAGVMQTPRATASHVTGSVVDKGGGALVGATVELVSEGVVVRTTTTNATGEFDFTNVPHGAYQMRVRLAGFSDLTQELTVGAAPLTPLHLSLAVAFPLADSITLGQHAKTVADALAAA